MNFESGTRNKKQATIVNILTFDIEDWFHIEFENDIKEWNSYESRLNSNIERIFSLLDKHKTQATFFCLGWVVDRYPEIIRKIDALGYEIGSHSYDHQLIFRKTKKQFEDDLKRSIHSIENCIGKKVRFFRAPAFSINANTLWFFEILNKYGIEVDASVFPEKRDFGGFPGFSPARPVVIDYNGILIKEFPMNTHGILGHKVVFSGGGYFRLFPYRVIKKFGESTNYMMTYLHPRDMDPDQPILNGLSKVRKFKSYVGLKSCYSKLDRLLEDFEFVNLSQAVDLIDWSQTDIIKLR